MECCRICLSSNSLSKIFETEEIAPNITAIACVDIKQDDGLPQYICLLCKHELDISINFKDKCETTFEMLKEQHAKEIEVRENIILNFLSGSNDKIPEQAREHILNSVKNSIRNGIDDVQNMTLTSSSEVLEEEGYYEDKGENGLISHGEDGICEDNNGICKQQGSLEEERSEMEVRSQGQMETIIHDEDQMITMSDADDQMTDITENEFEIPESLKMENLNFMCTKCNFCFLNETSLVDHLKRIHPATMGQCQICLLYFPTSELLRDHLSNKHDVTDDNENNLLRCKVCSNTFGLQSELNAHLCLRRRNFKLETHLENPLAEVYHQEFTCHQCNRVFGQYNLFRKHVQKHANINDKSVKIELCCTECNIRCSSHEEWNKHLDVCRVRGNKKPSNCVDCGKSFKLTTNPRTHQCRRKRIKPHVCSICQMTFYHQRLLESHLLQHVTFIKCTLQETYVNCVGNIVE